MIWFSLHIRCIRLFWLRWKSIWFNKLRNNAFSFSEITYREKTFLSTWLKCIRHKLKCIQFNWYIVFKWWKRKLTYKSIEEQEKKKLMKQSIFHVPSSFDVRIFVSHVPNGTKKEKEKNTEEARKHPKYLSGTDFLLLDNQ